MATLLLPVLLSASPLSSEVSTNPKALHYRLIENYDFTIPAPIKKTTIEIPKESWFSELLNTNETPVVHTSYTVAGGIFFNVLASAASFLEKNP